MIGKNYKNLFLIVAASAAVIYLSFYPSFVKAQTGSGVGAGVDPSSQGVGFGLGEPGSQGVGFGLGDPNISKNKQSGLGGIIGRKIPWLVNAKEAAVNFLAGKIIEYIYEAIGGFFTIIGYLVSLAAQLFNLALQSFESYTKTPVVKDGWKYVLGFANMFFAVILVVIAFATITGNQTYGMKSLLGKLIFAAIIINFSLVICGAIIDVGQIFLHYFLDKMTETDKDVGTAFTAGMKIATIHKYSNETEGGDNLWIKVDKAPNRFLILATNFVFGIIFLIAAIIAFLGGFFLLIFRMVALWFLIIFSPLAWIASILPRTRSYFTEWWNNFINQVIVGPVYVFCIYLAYLFMTKGGIGQITGQALSNDEPWFKVALQYWVIIAIMMGGFIVAPKLGGKGADIVLNAAKSAQKGATKWAKGTAGAAATEIGRGLTKTGAYQGVANWMAGKPIIGKLGTRMQLGAAELIARKQKEIEDRGKKHAGLDAKQQGQAFKSGKWEDKIGILDNLSKDPTKLAESGLTDAEIKNALALAKQRGVLNKETKWANLQLMEPADIDNTIEGAKGDDFGKLSIKAFSDPRIQAAIQRQITKEDSNIRGHHLIDFARHNPTATPTIRTFMETSKIHGGIQREILNNSGKHYLGIGKTKSEIVDRETEREMNDPRVKREISQKVDEERLNEARSDLRYISRVASQTTPAAKAAAEKALREEIDLEKVAGGQDINAYVAAEAAKQGKAIADMRRELQEAQERQDRREKQNRHREARRNLRSREIETNLSREAATAPAGSLAHQYGTAFEFRKR